MKKDVTYFKEKLEKERALVIKELKQLGVVKDDRTPDDWQALPSDIDVQKADENEVSDFIESYEGNNALVHNLEPRLVEIDAALESMKKGTYGVCSVCGEKIEDERLEANPAAHTCKKHLDK